MSSPLMTKQVLKGKCQDCQKYLSVGPIMIIWNRPLCGRCVEKIPNAPGTTADFYEEIAKFMNFPCSYDNYGCDEIVPWNSNHERMCEYASLLCPAIGCDYQVRKMDVFKHFVTYHQDLIITDNGFEIPYAEQEIRTNKIFIYQGKLLILKLHFEHETAFMNVTSLTEPEERVICVFELTDNDNKIFYQHQIEKYHEKYDTDDETIEYDSFCKIRYKNKIFCNISFSDLEFYKKNILPQTLCPICDEYTRPPLMSCLNGHIVCSRCYRKLDKSVCPLCRKSLEKSHHFVLNNVFKKFLFPCIYEELGCTAFGYPKEISLHESQCHYFFDDTIECYLKAESFCSWVGSFSSLAKHMFLHHIDRFVFTGIPIKDLLSDLRHKICYTEFNKDLFRITIHYEREIGFCLKIGLKSRLTHHIMYQYYLEFSNNTDSYVSPRTNIINEPTEFNLVITSRHIKPFLNQNELKFTIHIEKL